MDRIENSILDGITKLYAKGFFKKNDGYIEHFLK